jgi:cysteinyl-tRNA synthetase
MAAHEPPAEIEAAAAARSDARARRDWSTADRLRAEIEAAGWKVIDAGTAYRLERADPPDVEVGGEIRYGRSDAVPSRLDEPATGLATVVVPASSDRAATDAAIAGLLSTSPDTVDVVIVADGLPDASVDGLAGVELIRTSAVLGHAAALNAGIRRARAPVVVVMDPSIVPTGDIVTPLVETLDDPTTAVVGPFGLVSDNLRQFDEVIAGDAVAIQGYLQAFRRSDYIERGPLDEGFRFYRNLDIWWSLVLRDEGEDRVPRRAAVVPGLPLERGEPTAWTATPPAVRDRLSKRNFYRVLDRFRTRLDLAS